MHGDYPLYLDYFRHDLEIARIRGFDNIQKWIDLPEGMIVSTGRGRVLVRHLAMLGKFTTIGALSGWRGEKQSLCAYQRGTI